MFALSRQPGSAPLQFRLSSTVPGISLSRANNSLLVFGRACGAGTVSVEVIGLRAVSVRVVSGMAPLQIAEALSRAFGQTDEVHAEANRYGDAAALYVEDRKGARRAQAPTWAWAVAR
jgi:hypothetical protein